MAFTQTTELSPPGPQWGSEPLSGKNAVSRLQAGRPEGLCALHVKALGQAGNRTS